MGMVPLTLQAAAHLAIEWATLLKSLQTWEGKAWVQCTRALDPLGFCHVSSFIQFLYTWQHLNGSSATVHWTQAIPNMGHQPKREERQNRSNFSNNTINRPELSMGETLYCLGDNKRVSLKTNPFIAFFFHLFNC
jgi:hypothetical protein